MSQSNRKYEEALNSFPSPDPSEDYEDLPALGKELTHNTLLEEFIFWTFKYEFPQNVEHTSRSELQRAFDKNICDALNKEIALIVFNSIAIFLNSKNL